MASSFLPDLSPETLAVLHRRAAERGCTVEEEAKRILEEAIQSPTRDVWAEVEAIRRRLAASGRQFSDSADLVREDRDR